VPGLLDCPDCTALVPVRRDPPPAAAAALTRAA